MAKNFDFREMLEFKHNFETVRDRLPQFLHDFILQMAYRALSQTKKLTPVDTGELRNKWEVTDVKVGTTTIEATIINPQEYASFVEDGHWQRRRWLPGKFKGKRFVYEKGAKSGIMLREKWIPGHYMARISIERISNEIPKRFEREFTKWLKKQLGD